MKLQKLSEWGIEQSEPVCLNIYGAQELIPNSASLCSLAGRYDNPIPTRCLAPIDCLKIPAQLTGAGKGWGVCCG
jgi:hypothetical protein